METKMPSGGLSIVDTDSQQKTINQTDQTKPLYAANQRHSDGGTIPIDYAETPRQSDLHHQAQPAEPPLRGPNRSQLAIGCSLLLFMIIVVAVLLFFRSPPAEDPVTTTLPSATEEPTSSPSAINTPEPNVDAPGVDPPPLPTPTEAPDPTPTALPGRPCVVVSPDLPLNVRSQPGTALGDATVIGTLPSGTEVRVLEGPLRVLDDNFAWVRIEAGDLSGWVAGEYLDCSS